jgi:hypothetical protein
MMRRVETRDYLAWHDDYDRPGSALHLRLLVVQDLLSLALDESPVGPVRLISMCAGQGHDVVTVARRHRRGGDITGRLVELDPRNVEVARRAIDDAGLGGLEVFEGDAGCSDSYTGAAPADVVLACGIFGNITDEEVHDTVRALPSLCAENAWVLWTRGPRDDDIVHTIEGWFAGAGFEPVSLVVGTGGLFGVGAARYRGAPRPWQQGETYFGEFSR